MMNKKIYMPNRNEIEQENQLLRRAMQEASNEIDNLMSQLTGTRLFLAALAKANDGKLEITKEMLEQVSMADLLTMTPDEKGENFVIAILKPEEAPKPKLEIVKH